MPEGKLFRKVSVEALVEALVVEIVDAMGERRRKADERRSPSEKKVRNREFDDAPKIR
jgi:hypothetical protein